MSKTPSTAADSTIGNVPWWRDVVVYQIYPRSFADGNGDGMGDLAGVTARLDYLAELGIGAIWFSPFYLSPQADAGYDVADYRQIDPRFGTLEDFDALQERAGELGIRIIVDLVPNHTSDEHEWFRAALAAGPGSPERERYIFRDSDGLPNNWDSMFGGPAWTRVSDLPPEIRGDASDDQWFLHLFDSRQPDLNWDHPDVHAEFVDILQFWAKRGVEGFRVDVAHGLVKAPGLPDQAGHAAMVEGARRPDGPSDTIRLPMFDQDGVHDIYREWRKGLDEVNPNAALIAEAWVEPPSRLALYVRPDEMQQAFNFSYLVAPWNRDALREVITSSKGAMDEVGATTTWVLSNHDVIRHATRLAVGDGSKGPNGIKADDPQPDATLGLRRALAATVQMLALPGSAYIYQGEELGLPEHTSISDEAREDPTFLRTNGEEAGRDGCRVPLPWASQEPAYGFSNGLSDQVWLPQPASFQALAADQQVGVPGSTFELYRRALELRSSYGLGAGTLTWRDDLMAQPDVLAFENSGIVVLQNFGSKPVAVNLTGEVVLASAPATETESSTVLTVPSEGTIWALVQE